MLGISILRFAFSTEFVKCPCRCCKVKRSIHLFLSQSPCRLLMFSVNDCFVTPQSPSHTSISVVQQDAAGRTSHKTSLQKFSCRAGLCEMISVLQPAEMWTISSLGRELFLASAKLTSRYPRGFNKVYGESVLIDVLASELIPGIS